MLCNKLPAINTLDFHPRLVLGVAIGKKGKELLAAENFLSLYHQWRISSSADGNLITPVLSLVHRTIQSAAFGKIKVTIFS